MRIQCQQLQCKYIEAVTAGSVLSRDFYSRHPLLEPCLCSFPAFFRNTDQKVKPRTARRAAAELQSLFDVSLTFSSPNMMTGAYGGNGIEGSVISPAVQVLNLWFIMFRRVVCSSIVAPVWVGFAP